MSGFDYDLAFSRNIGLVQPDEQRRLKESTVAVAGMGVGNFRIADFDIFELHNFNRQVGATCSTLGQNKGEVMQKMAHDINPEAQVDLFPEGVQPENVDRFLNGVDVAVDGLDYFAVEARELFYKKAYEKGIPVVAAGPIGCSTALLVFMPGGMTWHDYFGMKLAKDVLDKYVLFLIGTAPAATQMSYIDRSRVNLAEKRGPSLSLAVQLCAGVVAAETMKLLLKRGKILAVPYYQQFDAYKCKHVIGKLHWGNCGPIQRLKFMLFRKMLAKHL